MDFVRILEIVATSASDNVTNLLPLLAAFALSVLDVVVRFADFTSNVHAVFLHHLFQICRKAIIEFLVHPGKTWRQ